MQEARQVKRSTEHSDDNIFFCGNGNASHHLRTQSTYLWKPYQQLTESRFCVIRYRKSRLFNRQYPGRLWPANCFCPARNTKLPSAKICINAFLLFENTSRIVQEEFYERHVLACLCNVSVGSTPRVLKDLDISKIM